MSSESTKLHDSAALSTRWATLGSEVQAPGNRPVLLDDPGFYWYVAQGSVEVFAAPMLGDSKTGLRTHLWSAEAGSALPCGLKPEDPEGLALLAVGGSHTLLRRISRATLEELGAAAGSQADVAAFVESALSGMGRAVASRGQPRISLEVDPKGTLALKTGERIGTAAPVWVALEEGAVTFADGESRVAAGRDHPFPMVPGLWLRGVEDTQVSGFPTLAVLQEGHLWKGVDEALQEFLRWTRAMVQVDREGESARIHAKIRAEARMMETELGGLASVLGDAHRLPWVPGAENPLMAACQAVGKVAGITFNPPAKWEMESKVRDPLGSICRISRVRFRSVALRGTWWKEDGGPLLGYRGEEKVPSALIPTSSTSYDILDPGAGTREAVTEEVAKSLDPFAVTFYRPAPARALAGKDLFELTLSQWGRDLWLILLLALASAILGMVLPIATKQFFSVVIPQAQSSDVWTLLAAMVAVVTGGALFDLTRAFLLIRVETRSTLTLQAALIDRLLSLPAPFFRRYSVGDLATRAGAVNAVRDILSGAATVSILGSFSAITSLGLLFYFDYRLAGVAVVLVLVAGLVTLFFGQRTLGLERERQEVQGQISGLIFQMLGGVSKLKVAAAERRAFAVWAEKFKEQQEISLAEGKNDIAIQTLNDSMPVLSTLVLFGTAGFFLSRGHSLDVGTFVAFNAAFGTFFAACTQLNNTLVTLLNIPATMERAKPILTTPPEVDETKPDPGELSGKIEGSHLHFRYREDGPLILNDISFTAEPGEFVAFVGPSGSGKSTTLRLLLGFEQPESGALYFDDQDLSSVNITSVRNQMGVVLQSSQLMAGDIFRNIVGSSPLTPDDAWEAAEQAGLADDIRDMPMGIHTVISEGGSTLSGGQRQRLLVARALVRKPRIILFDEATSALDNRTQEQVSRSLEATKATRIVIAHRLSTIRKADRIYVIESGRVIQEGNFDELMSQGGLFGRLVARQLA
jgi:NHLM bacteriocin system ABC transporter ATP-binding protein